MNRFFKDKAEIGEGDFFAKYEPGQEDTDPIQEQTNEEVNGIIMKIELKKFQKLIENRIQRKNALLKADIKRMYPMCNHSNTKLLADEFKSENDILQGHLMFSPKEYMTKT